MSTDPKRIGTDESLTDLYDRVRALERRSISPSRWALFKGGLDAAAATGQQYVSMDEIVTNDEGLYFLFPGTGGNTGKFGPGVTEEGVYKVSYATSFSLGTLDDVLVQYYDGDIGIRSNWFFGNDTCIFESASLDDSNMLRRAVRFAEIRIVGGDLWIGPVTLPQGEIPWVANITAARSFSAVVSVLIEKLSDDYSDNLFPGSPF